MAHIATQCGVIAVMVIFTILTAGEAHEEPQLDADALATLLIQRGGVAGEIIDPSVEQRKADANIEFAEAKAMADMGFSRPQTDDLAALESKLHLQVAKAKAKLKKGAGGASAKKAASLAKKVLALTKKVKKERKAPKKKKVKATKKKAAPKTAVKDPISVRLTEARQNYMTREKKESADVKADEAKIGSLTKMIGSLTERLAKAKSDLTKTRAALTRHRDLHDFDFKAYQKVKAKETHRKKMVVIRAAIRKQRERVRKERDEEEASNEQLQKYEDRKKRLISYHAKRLAAINGNTSNKGKPSSPGHRVVGGDAVAKAVAAVEKSIANSHLEEKLKPQMTHLKAKLKGAALHKAVGHLVSQAVASSVDADLQSNPKVKGAIADAVTQLRHKLGLPHYKSGAKKKSVHANSSLAAKAKVQADAAVAKVQAARKSLNAANARLSNAVNAAGHKGLLNFAELLQE